MGGGGRAAEGPAHISPPIFERAHAMGWYVGCGDTGVRWGNGDGGGGMWRR